MKVYDRVHEATKDLPEYWDRTDGWYNFTANVRGVAHVLDTVVEDPFAKQPQGNTLDGIAGGTMGADHPVSWCKDYKGGRSFYTGLGNTVASFNAGLTTHLKGAINWAAGQSDPVYSDCGATVLKNYQQVKVSGPPNLSEPIGFDQFPDGRVIQTDRRGGVHLHDPVTGTSTTIANIPVYTVNEDGLYGPGIDNNFASNHWVYLYYSPPTVKDVKLSDGSIVTQTTPLTAAPNTAATFSAWDPWVGYFQLSRFKFVDAAPGSPAHLDLDSEEEILRVANNRGACCHVAGDIDFDKHNNLWLVTGDDSPSGGGNSGGFSPFNDSKTDESQTVRVNGATGGTFTLTFNGQTTAPLAFNATAAAIQSAVQALSSVGAGNAVATGGPVNTANVTVTFRGALSEADQPQMTADGSGLTGTTPAVVVNTTTAGGLWNAPHVDSRRSALNTNDLRGKLLRFQVKDGTIAPADENRADFGSAARTRSRPATCSRWRAARRRPRRGLRSTRWASGTRSASRWTRTTSRTSATTRRTRRCRSSSAGRRARAGSRSSATRRTTAGRSATGPTSRTTTGTSTRRHRSTRPRRRSAAPGRQGPERLALEPRGRPGSRTGPGPGPRAHQPGHLVLVPGQQRDHSARHALLRQLRAERADRPARTGVDHAVPAAVPGAVHGRRRAARHSQVPVRRGEPDTKKFPPYYDNSVILGEFTQDTLREVKLDSQNRDLQDQQVPGLRRGAPARPGVPVRVRQPDGHAVGRRRFPVPADIRRRVLRDQPRRRHVQVGLRQGDAPAEGRADGGQDRRSDAAHGQLLERRLARRRIRPTRSASSGTSGTARSHSIEPNPSTPTRRPAGTRPC